MLQCLRELSVARSPYDDLVAECTERVWTCQGCEKGRWSALQEIKKIRKQKRARLKFVSCLRKRRCEGRSADEFCRLAGRE